MMLNYNRVNDEAKQKTIDGMPPLLADDDASGGA